MSGQCCSNNTSIVSIVVLVLVALAAAYFFGFFGPRNGGAPQVVETPAPIEQPAAPEVK